MMTEDWMEIVFAGVVLRRTCRDCNGSGYSSWRREYPCDTCGGKRYELTGDGEVLLEFIKECVPKPQLKLTFDPE